MINKRDYESLQIEGQATPASPLNQKSEDEAPTPWYKTNKFLFLGLTVFLFFGISMTTGSSEDANATLGHSDPGSAFCCYYSKDMSDPCGTCKSKEDSGDWCSATLEKCVDCGGVFCPATDTPSLPPLATDDDDDDDDDDTTDAKDNDDKASAATDPPPPTSPPAAAADDDTAPPAADDTPAP